ncbi:hypothetical protein CYMTET_10222 [Cymbomonas tetramitiformis]|uniref:Fucosyltransferase n=1 Tax=Cymbomonas tetramitiformis TaxID=36881 RepID=A0AAE0LEP5_9CHLO|nr:hypothetical protein CYMTET_15797 [Cymbomonas tetramitiformis]KAK3282019.1 hypothetical protein CYMTET_10222 [Cymbomonas tetramitiformis]
MGRSNGRHTFDTPRTGTLAAVENAEGMALQFMAHLRHGGCKLAEYAYMAQGSHKLAGWVESASSARLRHGGYELVRRINIPDGVLRPPAEVSRGGWRYGGDDLPSAGAVQWVIDSTCHNKQLGKEVIARKAELEKEGFTTMAAAESDVWREAVFWGGTKPITSLRRRPLLLLDGGETFWGSSDPYGSSYGEQEKGKTDVVFYRARTAAYKGVFTMHFSNGATSMLERVRNSTRDLLLPAALMSDPEASHARAQRILSDKEHFCAFLIIRCYFAVYQPDALIRVVFFQMLQEFYKECHGMGGCQHTEGYSCAQESAGDVGKGWNLVKDVSAHCYRRYKFAMAFENQREEGYLSEKMFNALMGDTVPIYFGDPGVHRHVNPARFVHCDVDPASIDAMRKYWKENNIRQQRRRSQNLEPRDAELLAYIRGLVESSLRPCVEEVVRLDRNDTAYLEMISQPIVPGNTLENTIYDGGTMSRGLVEILRAMDSPIFDAAASAAPLPHVAPATADRPVEMSQVGTAGTAAGAVKSGAGERGPVSVVIAVEREAGTGSAGRGCLGCPVDCACFTTIRAVQVLHAQLTATAPGSQIVLVGFGGKMDDQAGGSPPAAFASLRDLLTQSGAGSGAACEVEALQASLPGGRYAAVNAGIRRARHDWVLALHEGVLLSGTMVRFLRHGFKERDVFYLVREVQLPAAGGSAGARVEDMVRLLGSVFVSPRRQLGSNVFKQFDPLCSPQSFTSSDYTFNYTAQVPLKLQTYLWGHDASRRLLLAHRDAWMATGGYAVVAGSGTELSEDAAAAMQPCRLNRVGSRQAVLGGQCQVLHQEDLLGIPVPRRRPHSGSLRLARSECRCLIKEKKTCMFEPAGGAKAPISLVNVSLPASL